MWPPKPKELLDRGADLFLFGDQRSVIAFRVGVFEIDRRGNDGVANGEGAGGGLAGIKRAVVRDYGSISTSTKPVESTSIRSRSVRNGCGFANDFFSLSSNSGTSEVFLPAFLNALA